MVIFLFSPILAFEGDGSMRREIFSNYTTTASLILTMGASIATGAAFIALLRGTLIVRILQHCLIAGIVMGGSASYYITNPGTSILLGFAAAIMQIGFDYLI